MTAPGIAAAAKRFRVKRVFGKETLQKKSDADSIRTEKAVEIGKIHSFQSSNVTEK
jgi:hypothetical protein